MDILNKTTKNLLITNFSGGMIYVREYWCNFEFINRYLLHCLFGGDAYHRQTRKGLHTKNIMFRAIASIVLFILFSFEVAIDIVLNHSAFILGLDIICTVLWAINFCLNFSSFKKSKDEATTIEIRIIAVPYSDNEDDKDEETEESDKSEETENK